MRKRKFNMNYVWKNFKRVFLMKSYCHRKFGKIAIVTLITNNGYEAVVNNALVSMNCYAKMRCYAYYLFKFDEKLKKFYPNLNSRLYESCLQLPFLFIRHCLVLNTLMAYDYVAHTDGDTGVVNPNHCFEEYIIPGVDIFHLERFHSGEIQAGHYIVKNTEFSKTYLSNFIDSHKKFKDVVDNSLLYFPLAENTMNDNDWNQCKGILLTILLKNNNGNIFASYDDFKKCVKQKWGKQRHFKKIIVYRRSQDFARDGWLTKFTWSDVDFMIHAMKYQDDVLFERKLSHLDCSTDNEWILPLKNSFYISNIESMREIWLKTDILETFLRDNFDNLNCWPNCPYNLE
ncbi:uncharacterized protein LOC136075496 isoform X2 [Hydra vulgaris]|uniref:Uncharacterized protein LOC136075496 isoform X2 n=1 Tax=Hydra vulgaris TaxID=6087 RepID=A0ABM4B7T4_HYDVU